MGKKHKSAELEKMESKLRRLAQSLAETGPILQGSVNQIWNKPLRPGAKTGGPYYSWTWKRKAKTHTVAISQEQARAFRTAVENNRKLKNIVEQMRQLSLQILNAKTKGVKKRKPTKNQHDEA